MNLENSTVKVEENLNAVNAETTWILCTLYICVDKSPVTKLQRINLRLQGIIQHYFSSAK